MQKLAPILAAFVALGLPGATPVSASGEPLKGPDPEATRTTLAEIQQRDQRLLNIGWRLVRGNEPFCEKVIPSIGLQLVDAAGYGGPETVQKALGLSGNFAVQSVALGSPADLSSALFKGREITRIADADPNSWPAQSRLDWKRLTRANDTIDAKLSKDGSVTFGFSDGSQARVEPVAVCATRFEVLGNSKRAVAEGSRVIIGSRFPAFAWEEDADFAGVIAHELAHNLLKHRVWLDRNKRKRRNIRLTEREADRLMPWLLANAGYEPEAAYRFMVRWGKKHDGGLFRARTHDGWDERADFIAAELPIIKELMEQEGKADWSVHFRREIDPEMGLPTSKDVAPRE
ncbi:MAG: hypothetical protein HRT64_04630 [Erythrobacter sp.]|nr:hypothetical protein [Erythrobacter sp.]